MKNFLKAFAVAIVGAWVITGAIAQSNPGTKVAAWIRDSVGTAIAFIAPNTAATNAAVSVPVQLNPLSPGIIALGPNSVANALAHVSSSQYPANAVTTSPAPLVAKGSGSTGAVTGTLTPASTATAYVCGFNVSYVGGVAQVGPLVLSGLLGGSFTFQTPLSTATGGNNFSQTFNPCIPASAVNTPIVMTTVADGTATAVDVNIWGYGL